ncbi:MAG TPA: histidine kinase N-terminal 7TM domain-containing protein, partial [Anaerolineales bacterium]|nr:histidine kinase N-terminal 7TM domain-containing protein [Anaerolineales bacterium]
LFLTGSASLWALGYTFEIAATSLAAKVFWAKCQYFVIPVIPTLFLVFTLVYTHREKWLLSVRYLLFVFPVLMPVLAVTTEWHGLLWKSYILSLDAPFPNLVITHGEGFWVFWIYCQLLLLLSTVSIFYDLRRFSSVFQGQVRFLLLAVLAPWFTNALYVLKMNPVPGYDWTPFAFAISVTAFSWASLRYQFGALMPIAHQIIFENLREGAIVLDPTRRIVEINQAAQAIVGLTQEAIGQTISEALPYSSPWHRHLTHIAEMKRDFCLNETPPLYYELQMTPLHARNLPQQGWLVLLRDITQQKISEKRLQETEAKYRALVENSPFVTYLFDDQVPSFVSSQVESLLGYSVSELLGTPTLWNDLIHPDDRARVMKELIHHRETGETFRSEYRLLARNGQCVWVQDKALRMQMAPYSPYCTVGVWQDITEQKIFSQQLIEKAEELKRSNVDLQQFAYAVSHDLQEPLRTVNAYIQLFQRRYAAQVDEDALEIIRFIVDGAHRMKAMIEDLLEYSRVTTKGQSLTLTDCNQVVERQLNYLLPLHEQNQVQIASDPLPYLLVDEVQIGQLFRNLLGNALKY